MHRQQKTHDRFVQCVRNEGFEVSLELHRWYEMLPDPEWESRGCIRIIDESGERLRVPSAVLRDS
jgi:hypothetical protein